MKHSLHTSTCCNIVKAGTYRAYYALQLGLVDERPLAAVALELPLVYRLPVLSCPLLVLFYLLLLVLFRLLLQVLKGVGAPVSAAQLGST